MRIGKRRFEWKPWNWSTRTWIIALLVLVAAAPFVTRWCCLWQVPDVHLPFDEDEFTKELPEESNAFRFYQAAAKELLKVEPSWLEKSLMNISLAGLPNWDERLDQWLPDNKQILAEFRRGTECDQFRAVSWKTLDFMTWIPLHKEFPKLILIAQAEALRCEKSGDVEEATQWHLACLQSGRHYEMNGFRVAVAMGRRFRRDAYDAISRWTANPRITLDQLRSMRKRISAGATWRLKDSDILKVEYLSLKQTLHRTDFPETLFPNWSTSPQYEPMLGHLKRWMLWTIGEPELSLRLARQMLVNQLQHCDVPPDQRVEPIRSAYPAVYPLIVELQRQHGQLSPVGLIRSLESSTGARLIQIEALSDIGQQRANVYRFDAAWRLYATANSLIDVVFAAQEYHRVHNQFPPALESLIPDFLDVVPIDEFSTDRSVLKYRRKGDDEALVWSCHMNGSDDGGEITVKDPMEGPKDRGHRIKFEREQLREVPQ